MIRPAIVAANSYGVEIHWQERMFRGAFVQKSVEKVLNCIAVSGNAEMLYELLQRYPEEFLGPLGSHPLCEHLEPLIDDRIVPILAANLTSGTAEMLESLSRLARKNPGTGNRQGIGVHLQSMGGSFQGKANGRRTRIESPVLEGVS